MNLFEKERVYLVGIGETKEGFREEQPRRSELAWTDAIHNDSFIWAKAKAESSYLRSREEAGTLRG